MQQAFLMVNIFNNFLFFNQQHYTMRNMRLLAFLGTFLGIYPLFWQRLLER
jgi:hypothetical protein